MSLLSNFRKNVFIIFTASKTCPTLSFTSQNVLELLGRNLSHHKMAESLTKVLFDTGHKTADFRKRFTFHLHVKETGPEKRKVREIIIFFFFPSHKLKCAFWTHKLNGIGTPSGEHQLYWIYWWCPSLFQYEFSALLFSNFIFTINAWYFGTQKTTHTKRARVSLCVYILAEFPLHILLSPHYWCSSWLLKWKGRQGISMKFIHRCLEI